MEDLLDLVDQAEKLRGQLIELAGYLDKHHRNVKIAKLVASASACVGGGNNIL